MTRVDFTPRRIRIIHVLVDESRAWGEAVKAAGRGRPSCGIWEVGEQYPSLPNGPKLKQVVLANFNPVSVCSVKAALGWGIKRGFGYASPRTIFAIGEQKPDLHQEVRVESMYVVSSKECRFNGRLLVPAVCFWENRRLALLRRFDRDLEGLDWIAFLQFPTDQFFDS